ncbi:MAG: esterase [Clostridia bacterium]|nr:esterase [Clostridia bacterium]MBR4577694.1 esterase [Clostridia bacterium]
MARLHIEYYSHALRRETSFEMMIPNDPRPEIPWEQNSGSSRPLSTLFLLHGYTGKAGNWVPDGLPEKYHFAIVMPTAENSFYLNGEATGTAYQTMVGEELVDYVRKTFRLACGPEDTCIAGLSMGGFGALHTGLAYPDRFGKIGALSSALIHHEVAQMQPGGGNEIANYAYYRACFGDPATLLERDVNPEVLARRLKAAGAKIPDIYMCCGTEDFLIENNRQMHRFLEAEGIPHEYHESKGIHDMVFWHEYIAKIVAWMFG